MKAKLNSIEGDNLSLPTAPMGVTLIESFLEFAEKSESGFSASPFVRCILLISFIRVLIHLESSSERI